MTTKSIDVASFHFYAENCGGRYKYVQLRNFLRKSVQDLKKRNKRVQNHLFDDLTVITRTKFYEWIVAARQRNIMWKIES